MRRCGGGWRGLSKFKKSLIQKENTMEETPWCFFESFKRIELFGYFTEWGYHYTDFQSLMLPAATCRKASSRRRSLVSAEIPFAEPPLNRRCSNGGCPSNALPRCGESSLWLHHRTVPLMSPFARPSLTASMMARPCVGYMQHGHM